MKNVFDYLDRLATHPHEWITLSTAVLAKDILYRLVRDVPNLGKPNVSPGPDGMVGFTWRTDANYFNITILENRTIECYYETLVHDTPVDRCVDNELYEDLANVPTAFIEKMKPAFKRSGE